MDTDLGDVLRAFPPVSLRDLDQRAALLQRVDRKYAVDIECLRELFRRLQRDHEILSDVDLEVPDELAHSLTTSFSRLTLAARGGSQRLTCDVEVGLAAANGQTVRMRDGLVLVETKSEDGESPADQALAHLGVEPVSLSKYRVGIGLMDRAADGGPQPGSDLFG